jgi:preprotein translocase subunit SecA
MPANLRAALESAPEVAEALPAANTLGDLPEAVRTPARQAIGRATVNQLLRQIMLQVIGNLWVDYLTSVEALRTSVGLEAYAQRDPLVAYKSRAFDMFQELLVNMRSGVVARAFTYRPRTEQPGAAPGRAPAVAAPASPVAPGNGGSKPAAVRPPEAANLGRNDRCWCGSGKKYKDCHWDNDHASAPATAATAPAGASPAVTAEATPSPGGGKRKRRRH